MPTIARRLVIRRLDGETWKDVVARIAGAQGLAAECLEDFEAELADGRPQNEAAFNALSEWDCVPLEDVERSAARHLGHTQRDECDYLVERDLRDAADEIERLRRENEVLWTRCRLPSQPVTLTEQRQRIAARLWMPRA